LFCLAPEKRDKYKEHKEHNNTPKPSIYQQASLWEKRNDLTHIFRGKPNRSVDNSNEFPVEQLFPIGIRYKKADTTGYSINAISYEEISRKLSCYIGESIKILEQDPVYPHICRCRPVGIEPEDISACLRPANKL
jgi:hypothetical protein